MLRVFLVIVLIAFVVNNAIGGENRWFEIGMRIELRKCGGAATLQAWAQNLFSSPTKITYFDEHDFDPKKDLPPQFRRFANDFQFIFYRHTRPDGPDIDFMTGLRDEGWGVIVGRTDLPMPQLPSPGISPWTKKLRPGVFLYHWEN
ncbi:MAG TPA: hypothetical protein VGG19_16405 [Tepidisphaeraceae bacterium]|jgi:hypothetical protein